LRNGRRGTLKAILEKGYGESMCPDKGFIKKIRLAACQPKGRGG